MLPVEFHRSLSNHEHEVQSGVRLTDAVMRSCAEDEPIFGMLLGDSIDPSFRDE